MRTKLQEILDTYKWIKVKKFETPDFKWKTVDTLPPFGTLCEIVVKDHPPQNDTFEFVEGVGVSDKRNAFQWMGLNAMGLYEGAFFLDENLVTHWRVSPYYLLEDHHKAETEFLIKKVREQAATLLELENMIEKEYKLAQRGKRFGVTDYHSGRLNVLNEIHRILHATESAGNNA